jgi:hypothetical protein
MQYFPNLEEPEQAIYRAEALLRHEAQRSWGDQITVPLNCGQELYDVIELTDARSGIDHQNHRVLAIRTDYDTRNAQYDQTITLGAP